jgi:hypothetical protein
MIAKQILRSGLLVIVLGSLLIWAGREYQKSHEAPAHGERLPVVAGNQVVMTYFISGTRCESCRKIEALARETAEKDFGDALAEKRLVFRVIDTGEAGNGHYAKDYQLSSKTVILSHRKDGKETAWKDMAGVWDRLDDAQAFHDYLGRQIREFLGS